MSEARHSPSHSSSKSGSVQVPQCPEEQTECTPTKEGEVDTSFAQHAQLIPLLIPIVLLELGLKAFALVDLAKRTTTRGPKWIWVLVILLISLFGPITYFFFGREE